MLLFLTNDSKSSDTINCFCSSVSTWKVATQINSIDGARFVFFFLIHSAIKFESEKHQ